MNIKDLNDFTPNLNIDWVKVVNGQVMAPLRVTQESKLLLHSPSTLKSLSLALETIDKRIVADTFVLKFLYAHRLLFIVYPFDWRDARYSNNQRPLQRWEQCLNFVKDNMRPALELLQSKSHEVDNRVVEKFARDTVADFADAVKSFDEKVMSSEVKEKVLEKMSAIDYVAGLFHRNFTEDNLENFYDELDLTGDENIVESALKIEKFYKRLFNDYKFSFIKDSKSFLDSKSQSELLSYDLLSDELSKSFDLIRCF